MSALLTDVHQLHMMQACIDADRVAPAVFELFVHRLPPQRNFLVATGLEQALQFLKSLSFSEAEFAWLRDEGGFSRGLLDYARTLRFDGDVEAMPEGTVFFAEQPILRVTAALPLVQIALGAALPASGLVAVVLDPQVFFLLFLPPLLFLDGWRIPNDALRRDGATILRLALGLVVFSVLGMGLFIHWLIPAMPLAVAFALAAVIAPTDPIAVASIAVPSNGQGATVPPRLMHILQGEALLNDASGLVCMRFAVAAALTGSFSLPGALASFAWLAAAGLGIGALVTWGVARAMAWASTRYGEDGGAQILVTLLLPFGVYLLAESIGGSGILAAVAAGVTMSLTDLWPWRAATRLRRTAVWDMVQLAANGSIFVLLGAQIPSLLAAAPRTVQDTAHDDPLWLLGYVLLIVLALGALRFVWVWVSLQLNAIGARRRGTPVQATHGRAVLAVSLAGVRGAVTLAGVMSLPLLLRPGVAFPARDLAIALAAGVIVVSLLLATLALPRALRGLEWPDDSSDRVAELAARRAAAQAAVRAIEAAREAVDPARLNAQQHVDAAVHLLDMYQQRIGRDDAGGASAGAQGATHALERRLRLVGLRAERAEIERIGQLHGIEDLTLRKLVRELDHQEARHLD